MRLNPSGGILARVVTGQDCFEGVLKVLRDMLHKSNVRSGANDESEWLTTDTNRWRSSSETLTRILSISGLRGGVGLAIAIERIVSENERMWWHLWNEVGS